jgi:hypothetical protein
MANLIYDKLLSFGVLSLSAAGTFPDILNLGQAANKNDSFFGAKQTDANRMTVDVCCNGPAGGTGITVTVEGSVDETFSSPVDVGKNTFTLAEMKRGACKTAISPNTFQYLRVSVTATGSFTGGTAECFLNTYAGK